MSGWPLGAGQRYATLGADAAASAGTTLTADAAANTKGAWAELAAAAPFDTAHVKVAVRGDTAHVGYAIDIGVGAAASEAVLIPDLLVQARNDCVYVYEFPLSIPAGTRVAARCQAATGAATCKATVTAAGAPWGLHVPLSRVVAMGVNLADTGGSVNVDPGITINTKGAWSEIVASTAAPFRGLVTMTAGRGNTALSDVDWLMDIGIGAGGSETVLIPDLWQRSGANSDSLVPGTWPMLPVDIPAGTRLAARAQCSMNDASDRQFEIAAYGVV